MIAVSAKRGSVVARHAEASALAALYDDPVGPQGPLAGVLEGLRWGRALGFSPLACLPCDAPPLPLDLVSALAIALGKVLSRGEHPRVRDFLTDIGAAAAWLDDADAFANANTRAGLSAVEQSH